MRQLTITNYFIIAFVFVAACTPDRSQGLFEPQQGPVQDAVADTSPGHDGQTAVETSTLNGFWAKMDQSSTCVLVMGAAIESYSYNVSLYKMRELWRDSSTGRAWVRIEAPTCQKTMTPIVMNLAAKVPTKVLDTMVPPVFTCVIQAAEGTTIPESGDFPLKGASLHCPPVADIWGIKFDNPYEDPMPQNAADYRVYDQDKDGKPGVTLVLGDNMCDLYLAQRTIGMFDGTFKENGYLEAGFVSTLEQRVLEGTKGLCAAENETLANIPRSKVFLMRVDGHEGGFLADHNEDGDIDCQDLRSTVEELYQEYGVVLDKPDNAFCK